MGPIDKPIHVQRERPVFSSPVHVLATSAISAVRYCYYQARDTVTSTIRKVHDAALNVYAYVLTTQGVSNAIGRVLSVVAQDSGSQEKLERAQDAVRTDVNGDYYIENARFLGVYVTSFLQSALTNASVMPRHLQAPWLRELVWQKPDATYALKAKGVAFKVLLEQHHELISRHIECALLKGFCAFGERIQRLQSNNRFVFLELVKDLIKEGKDYIEECTKNVQKAFDERHAIERIIEVAFSLFLPNGHEDLDLPVRQSLAPYVKPILFAMIKDEIMPQVIEEALLIAKTPYVKTLMINEGLELEKINIEREYHPNVPALTTDYPSYKVRELEELLHPAMQVGFSYVMPDAHSLIKQASGVLAPAAAKTMIEELPKIHLQEIVRMGLEKLPLALNETGSWSVVEGRRIFTAGQFLFPHTEEAKLQIDARMAEKTRLELERLNDLVTTTGANPQRLLQVFQSKICRTNHAEYVHPSDSSGMISGLVNKVASFYGTFTKKAASMLMEQGNVREFIRSLNQGIVTKLRLPEHDRMYLVFSDTILNLLATN